MVDDPRRAPRSDTHPPLRAASPLIEADGISKVYNPGQDRIVVLDRLSLALDPGDTIGIVGASGIGKSTLLHILGTLDRPDSGRLNYRAENVLNLDDNRLARFRNRSIGFVFQFHHLLPEFSALENTMMPALIGGADRKSARTAAKGILERVGLSHRLNHRATELSGGNSSGWPWPGPWSCIRPSSWPTSRPATWIAKTASTSTPFCWN